MAAKVLFLWITSAPTVVSIYNHTMENTESIQIHLHVGRDVLFRHGKTSNWTL